MQNGRLCGLCHGREERVDDWPILAYVDRGLHEVVREVVDAVGGCKADRDLAAAGRGARPGSRYPILHAAQQPPELTVRHWCVGRQNGDDRAVAGELGATVPLVEEK